MSLLRAAGSLNTEPHRSPFCHPISRTDFSHGPTQLPGEKAAVTYLHFPRILPAEMKRQVMRLEAAYEVGFRVKAHGRAARPFTRHASLTRMYPASAQMSRRYQAAFYRQAWLMELAKIYEASETARAFSLFFFPSHTHIALSQAQHGLPALNHGLSVPHHSAPPLHKDVAKMTSPYLLLAVRREHAVEDVFNTLSRQLSVKVRQASLSAADRAVRHVGRLSPSSSPAGPAQAPESPLRGQRRAGA